MSQFNEQDIILFDGVCNLCNGAVDFVIKRDNKIRFKFGALQSKAVKKLLKNYEIEHDYLDSIIMIRRNEIFYKSTAALKITKHLKGFWPLLYPLIIVPAFIRDRIYDFIARNRYKWFGRQESCRLSTQEEASRFL